MDHVEGNVADNSQISHRRMPCERLRESQRAFGFPPLTNTKTRLHNLRGGRGTDKTLTSRLGDLGYLNISVIEPQSTAVYPIPGLVLYTMICLCVYYTIITTFTPFPFATFDDICTM